MLGHRQERLVLKRHFSRRGFNLLEVLVSLAIVSILLALGVPSFSQFLQNRKVRSAADGVLQGLSLAKVEAIRRNTRVQIAITADTGWVVGCVSPTNLCPANIQTRPGSEGAKNIIITEKTLIFNGFGRLSVSTENSTLDLSNPTAGTCERLGGNVRCLRIVVTPAGQLQPCDPKLVSTNAQACPET